MSDTAPTQPTTATTTPHRTRHPAKRKSRYALRRMFLRLCGAALTAGIAAPVHARYVEPFALDTTRHEVFLSNLPAQYDGFTIAHLTDLHRGPVTPDDIIRQAIALAVSVEPHLVVVTGDFVEHDPNDASAVGELLAVMTPPYGVWGCLGNHDHAWNGAEVAANLKKSGAIRLLINEAAEIAPGLWMAAVDDIGMGRPDAARALREVPADAALIYLTHNPVGVSGASERECLVLAGHTHGGQVVIPGLPPHLPSGMSGFSLIAGWGQFGKAHLYISRGVGMSTLPVRFNCRPEVALLTLRRGQQPPKIQPGLPERALRKAGRVARRLWHKVRV